MEIVRRPYSANVATALIREGVEPLLARILASRGIGAAADLSGDLSGLRDCDADYTRLKGAQAAAEYLAHCIYSKVPLLVVADYDCDGATACAVALRGLRAFGADAAYVVPDRSIHGYGLTPSVVDLALAQTPKPAVLITVDNGIASHEGVAYANERELQVVVTDHHLPRANHPLPAAAHIVNPSQPGCTFPSKALAGCGVIWYVLWALQVELKRRGMPIAPGFKISSLLPFVAIGTVADVVPLDRINRILVQAGLIQMRSGLSFPGIDAIATAGVAVHGYPGDLVTSNIAFTIGPRINAAGRLATMELGINCLMSDEREEADRLACQLAEINSTRKEVEHDIVLAAVSQARQQIAEHTRSITVYDASWHQGVIGIVAGRIKESCYRPTFVLTHIEETVDPLTGKRTAACVKGSGRSIPGFNLKDALDLINLRHPGLLVKFGGHAMAAGVTIIEGGYPVFLAAFEAVAREQLTADQLSPQLLVDGSLSGQELTSQTARLLRTPAWGQAFLEPLFFDEFEVVSAAVLGAKKDQLVLRLSREGVTVPAVKYRFTRKGAELPSGTVRVGYKLDLARSKKKEESLKLLIEHLVQVAVY